MRYRLLLQLASLLGVVICHVLAGQNLFCYYTNWSQYHGDRKFFPEDIDIRYCTHLVFAFAKVTGNRLAPYDPADIKWDYNGNDIGLYHRFNQLKTRNPALKTLLAVGGWNHGGANFSIMASTPGNRQEFISTSIVYLRRYGFDGLDIDWEYPGDPSRDGVPQDKANFAALIREMKAAFVVDSRTRRKPRLLLSAAVASAYTKVANGYDIPSLSRDLDFINVMTYDLHGAWDHHTGHNAGLYTASTDTDNYSVSQLGLNWARQADKRKINLGLAAYGRTWTLANPNNNGVGAPTIGPGNEGPYTKTKGILTYYEVCDRIRQGGYTTRFDQQTKTPYAFSGNQWITFDNVLSFQYKMSWLRLEGFAGAMLWAIDEDDFNGMSCGLGAYPLTKVASQCLMHGVNCDPADGGSVITRNPFTIRPTFQPSPTTPWFADPDCPTFPGIFRDRHNCRQYWMCFQPGVKYHFNCAYPKVFDSYSRVCIYSNVNCGWQSGR